MPQTLLTPTIITRKALESLVNNMVMAPLVYRTLEKEFHKIGTQITVRKPNKFTVRDGPVAQIQDINEPSVVLTVNKFKGVDFEFSDADMALTIDDFTERYINPAMIPLANQVDYDLLGLASQFSNVVGTPGVTPSTFQTSVALVGQRLDELAAPRGDRNLVVNPAASWAMAAAQSNSFVTKVSEKALVNGYLQTIGDMSIFMDQNVQNTTAGTVYSGTALSDAAVAQTGASIITNGWGSGSTTIKAGTVITFGDPSGDPGGGVYAVNPVSFANEGRLMNFRVTANISDTSGAITFAIDPPVIRPCAT